MRTRRSRVRLADGIGLVGLVALAALVVACFRHVVTDGGAARARLRAHHAEEVRAVQAALAPATKAAREAAATTRQLHYLLREEARTAGLLAHLAAEKADAGPAHGPPRARAVEAREVPALERRLAKVRDALKPLEREQAKRAQVLDDSLDRARAATARRAPEPGASLLPAVSLACLELDVDLRRRLGALHTEVPELEHDPRCAGDVVTDGMVHAYCAAAAAEDFPQAAAHLARIDHQLSCMSAQQVALLEQELVAVTQAVGAPGGGGELWAPRAREALRSTIFQIQAGPIFLVGERTRLFALGPKYAPRWFRWHRALLRDAAWRRGSVLEQLGLPVPDQLRDRLGFVTSRCIPSRAAVFRGAGEEPFVKFAGAGGVETCNPLGAMIDSMGLPCPATAWIPSGDSAVLAEAFTCAPSCGRGEQPPETSREVVARHAARGAGLAGFDHRASVAPAFTGPGECAATDGGDGGDGGHDRAGFDTLGQVAAACSTPESQLDSADVSACMAEAAHPEPLTYRSQRVTPRGPSGGPGCQVSQDADSGAPLPAETDAQRAEREAAELRQREQDAKVNAAMNKASVEGYTFQDVASWMVDGIDGDWATWRRIDPDGHRLRFINTVTGHTVDRFFPNPPGNPPLQAERSWERYRIDVIAWDSAGGVLYAHAERGYHVRDKQVVQRREIIDNRRRYLWSCDPDAMSCGTCTSTDLAAAAVNHCLGLEASPGRPGNDTGAPAGYDTRLGPLINVQPDATPELYDAMFASGRLCLGSGLERTICPGQSVTLCRDDQPDCGCTLRPDDMPTPDRADCDRMKCHGGLTSVAEGGTCGCGATVGGEAPDDGSPIGPDLPR